MGTENSLYRFHNPGPLVYRYIYGSEAVNIPPGATLVHWIENGEHTVYVRNYEPGDEDYQTRMT